MGSTPQLSHCRASPCNPSGQGTKLPENYGSEFVSLSSIKIVKIHVWVLAEQLPAFPHGMFWSLRFGLGFLHCPT